MTLLLILASLALPAGVGLVATIPLRRALPAGPFGGALRLAIAGALGLGVVSCAHFLWAWLAGVERAWIAELLVAVVAGSAWLVIQRRGGVGERAEGVDHEPAPRLVAVALILVAAVALGGFLAASQRNPHGAWDAWMTWNAHARFMYRGGAEWLVMFSEQTSLRHPDYPFMIPSLVARGWMYAGGESLLVPAGVALVYTALTALVLWSSLAVLRSRGSAALAGVLLLGTPFFVAHGASQYADVPVGLYLLVAVVLIALHDRAPSERTHVLLALGGSAAAMAAWTKNEGMLFIAALVVARTVMVLADGGWRLLLREAGWFAAGMAPVLVVVILFKVALAPPNDLLSAESQGGAQTLQRLTDPARYAFIARSVAEAVWSFGRNRIANSIAVLLVMLLALGVRRGGVAAARLGILTVVLVMLGNLLAYLTAPADMPRLLEGSIDRLLLQLWPTVLFVFFSVARTPEEVRAGSGVGAEKRAVGG